MTGILNKSALSTVLFALNLRKTSGPLSEEVNYSSSKHTHNFTHDGEAF